MTKKSCTVDRREASIVRDVSVVLHDRGNSAYRSCDGGMRQARLAADAEPTQ